MKLRVSLLFLLLSLSGLAQYGLHVTESYVYVVNAYIPHLLMNIRPIETPDGSGKGIMVMVEPRSAQWDADAFTVRLRYRKPDGKIFSTEQIFVKPNPHDIRVVSVFWLGDVTPLSVVASPKHWHSQEEAELAQ